MPRTARVTSSTESTSSALDALLERGRAQGHLSLREVRAAFDSAGISAAQGRSILHELTDAGVSLAAGEEEAPAAKPAPATDDGSFEVEAVEVADLDDTS